MREPEPLITDKMPHNFLHLELINQSINSQIENLAEVFREAVVKMMVQYRRGGWNWNQFLMMRVAMSASRILDHREGSIF